MSLTEFARALFALVLTLGLIGLAAVALRRYGPGAFARFGAPQQDRRLRIVESLVIDPARRLIIVECAGKERLVLRGEGRLMADLGKAPAKGGTTG